MPRGWLLVLCGTLLLWRPLSFVVELPQALPSMGMRGAGGVIELLIHGIVAAIAVAAVRAISIAMPAAPTLARVAVITSALTSLQSLYWSILPNQTIPGDELPLAILTVLHAAAWLLYLARSKRVRDLAA